MKSSFAKSADMAAYLPAYLPAPMPLAPAQFLPTTTDRDWSQFDAPSFTRMKSRLRIVRATPIRSFKQAS